jgi:hypothetical protein
MKKQFSLVALGTLIIAVMHLVAPASHALPVELVQNGGFDEMLTEWSSSDNVVALGSHFGVSTLDGSGYMAVLSQNAVASSWLNQGIGSFSGEAKVQFDWNLQWWAYRPVEEQPAFSNNDSFSVYLAGVELLSVSLGDILTSVTSQHPFSSSVYDWQNVQTTVDASLLGAGPLEIRFQVDNLNDEQFVSAYVDNVSIMTDSANRINPIGVPDTSATVIILGCALLGLEGFRRKFAKS